MKVVAGVLVVCFVVSTSNQSLSFCIIQVAGVVGRAELFCALYFFLSFLTYVHSCHTGKFSTIWKLVYIKFYVFEIFLLSSDNNVRWYNLTLLPFYYVTLVLPSCCLLVSLLPPSYLVTLLSFFL